MKKRFFAVLTAVLLLAACLPLGAVSVSADSLEHLSYEIVDGEVTITSCYPYMEETEITVPATIEGYPVTAIGERAFYWCKSIQSVTLPDSIVSIGYGAFQDCESLTEITIPDSVKTIGSAAFDSCSNLVSIQLGTSVTSIESSTFTRCISLESISIPDSVTSIGSSAFWQCHSLRYINIGKNVQTIDNSAFYMCRGIEGFSVDDANPYYCDDNNVLFNKNMTTLIKYPTARIGEYTIPDGVINISFEAFGMSQGLSVLSVPASLRSVGSEVFKECAALTAINVDPQNTAFSSIDGVLFTKDGTILVQYPQCKPGAYTIPSSVNTLWNYAFYGCIGLTSIIIGDTPIELKDFVFSECENLTSVTLGAGITNINQGAFSDCISLTSITINEGCTNIGQFSFASCDRLSTVTLPNSLLTIEDSAFSGCDSLTSIHIPAGVTAIGDAFDTCYELTSITVDNNNLKYSSEDGILFDKKKEKLICYPRAKEGAYAIPDNVRVEDMAFFRCNGITELTLPNDFTDISAFTTCQGIKAFIVGEDHEEYSVVDGVLFNKEGTTLVRYPIGKEGTSYTLPDSVTSISDYAFYLCNTLTEVYIPDGVTSIGEYAFKGCTIQDVHYAGSQSGWWDINIGENNDNLHEATYHYAVMDPEEPATQSAPKKQHNNDGDVLIVLMVIAMVVIIIVIVHKKKSKDNQTEI